MQILPIIKSDFVNNKYNQSNISYKANGLIKQSSLANNAKNLKTKSNMTFLKFMNNKLIEFNNGFRKILPPMVPMKMAYIIGASLLLNIVTILTSSAIPSLLALGLLFVMPKGSGNLGKGFEPSIITKADKLNLTKEQLLCKSIFLKEFSEEEAKETANKYNNILKSDFSEKNDFATTVFNELCNDYNIPKNMLNLDLSYKPHKSLLGKENASSEMDLEDGNFKIKSSLTENNLEILLSLVHELHHVKQRILEYKSFSSPEEMFDIELNTMQNLYPKHRTNQLTNKLIKDKNKLFNKHGIYINTVDKNSSIYVYARKLLLSPIRYPKNIDEYFKSMFEDDAVRAEKMMKTMLNNK